MMRPDRRRSLAVLAGAALCGAPWGPLRASPAAAGETVQWHAPLPDDMRQLIAELRED